MDKSYKHIIEKRLTNQPLMISVDKLDVITSEVTMRLLAGQPLDRDLSPRQPAEIQSKLPIIDVFGSLVAKGGAGASGFTSYESITSQLNYLVENGYTNIGLYIDSPGGEVAGCFALTDYMFSLREQGITLIGLTDGSCTSAAYAIGSACSKLYATAGSILGSIAVITAVVDATEADAQEGLKYHIIRSKSDKALGNPHEPTTDKIITEVEKRLLQYDNIFNASVTKYRPSVSMGTIVSLKGGTVLAEEALSLGLIDAIIPSIQEFINSTTNSLASNKSSINNPRGFKMTLEEALAANIKLHEENTSLKASLASIEAKGRLDEQQRILGILKAGDTFKMSVGDITKDIVSGATPEAATSIYERIAEATQAANSVSVAAQEQAGASATVGSKKREEMSAKDVVLATMEAVPTANVKSIWGKR